jgi:hypothetical protein
MRKVRASQWVLGVIALVSTLLPEAQAGYFTLPHFLEQGENSAGFEPEVTFTNGGGVAGSIKYQHGLTDFMNGMLTFGTGTGRRRFRMGADFTFDFVPDVENQPGIGLVTGATYYKYDAFGRLEVSVGPYLHKIFKNGAGNSVEPFLVIPIGPAFTTGQYEWQSAIVLGSIFAKTDEKRLSFVTEINVNLAHGETILSGGVSFKP